MHAMLIWPYRVILGGEHTRQCNAILQIQCFKIRGVRHMHIRALYIPINMYILDMYISNLNYMYV